MFERNEQMTSGKSSWTSYKQRPATKSDKWCRQTMPQWYQDKDEDGDDIGFIVTVPCQVNGSVHLGDIGGFIVRSKKISGLLLLQVVPSKEKKPEYTIVFYENSLPTRSRINIICDTKGLPWYCWPRW